jgi:hypothetical protein
MEVVEFEPEKVFRVKTQDGPMALNGWVLFEPLGATQMRVLLGGEFPGMDASMKETLLPMMENSAATIKNTDRSRNLIAGSNPQPSKPTASIQRPSQYVTTSDSRDTRLQRSTRTRSSLTQPVSITQTLHQAP